MDIPDSNAKQDEAPKADSVKKAAKNRYEAWKNANADLIKISAEKKK
ncbi:MAG: hypothetical protein LBJ31_11890 [Treponema sp.]|jgi:hypothetical protein|nr:hypothetical protein [Treponema sp.]